MAIAFLIASAAEIEKGVSAALELAAALDKPLAILCLESAVESNSSSGAKADAKQAKAKALAKAKTKAKAKAKAKASDSLESDHSADVSAFANRVAYVEEVKAAVAQQTKQKGFGGLRTEVFEIPVALDNIRRWLVRPPVTDKLGRFQIETLFIPFNRGAGTEDALETKNRLFNLVPHNVVFVSAKDDLDWKPAFEAIACIGRNRNELRTAQRQAREYRPAKTCYAEADKIDDAYQTVIVGVRGTNTHIEKNSAWNSLRRNEKTELVMAVNPADSWFERCHWRIDNGLHTIFAEYQMKREDRERLADELMHGTRSSPEFILFMSVSTLLAAIGLLENSGAVIIGAMLVAPLMTPLLGAGLAMLQGNWPLFSSAIKAVVFGISIALLIGMVVGFVASVIPREMFSGAELKLTGEMISRSHPNLLDPLIGLAGGLAGGFAIGRDKRIGALAGVAIAAALVPPIATAGLETAIVILCGIKQQSLDTVWQLLRQNPTELLAQHSLITPDYGDMQNVHLVFAPLALFVMNACAVILGTYVGLRLVGMHRTMYPRASRGWVTRATVTLLIALLILLMAIPMIAHYAR